MQEPDWLEYFAGGVPTGGYFHMTLDELRAISARDSDEWSGISRLRELCFIGLVCYFEAFCTDHFASLINLEPSLVSNLKASGQDVTIDATHVVMYGVEVDRRIGFVLAERYDFGTAQKINALFGALLKVTPFSKSEAGQYATLLRDRNLLVHHGGTYTLSYLDQGGGVAVDRRADAFFNSRVLSQQDMMSALEFIESVARKLIRASHAALVQYLEGQGRQYSGGRKKALDGMLWWGEAPNEGITRRPKTGRRVMPTPLGRPKGIVHGPVRGHMLLSRAAR